MFPAPICPTALLLAGDVSGVLTAIAAICTALAWPVLVGLVLWWFREPAAELLKAAVGVAAGANRFKIWEIEFDRDVQQQVAQSESAALVAPAQSPASAAPLSAADAQSQATRATAMAAAIPASEVAAASGVRSLLEAAPNSTLRKAGEAAIKTRMLGFAQEYETVRASMGSGPERTRAMNAVVAKMRTLALAADLFLDELMQSPGSPGRRLAAIAILQMKPQPGAVPWLQDRMAMERPFVFFHASVALLNAVRQFGPAERVLLGNALRSSLTQVQSFGEQADTNTVRLLTLALSELGASL